MRESNTQCSQKVYVWVDIIVEHNIGPIFIDGNLTAKKYMCATSCGSINCMEGLCRGSMCLIELKTVNQAANQK